MEPNNKITFRHILRKKEQTPEKWKHLWFYLSLIIRFFRCSVSHLSLSFFRFDHVCINNILQQFFRLVQINPISVRFHTPHSTHKTKIQNLELNTYTHLSHHTWFTLLFVSTTNDRNWWLNEIVFLQTHTIDTQFTFHIPWFDFEPFDFFFLRNSVSKVFHSLLLFLFTFRYSLFVISPPLFFLNINRKEEHPYTLVLRWIQSF